MRAKAVDGVRSGRSGRLRLTVEPTCWTVESSPVTRAVLKKWALQTFGISLLLTWIPFLASQIWPGAEWLMIAGFVVGAPGVLLLLVLLVWGLLAGAADHVTGGLVTGGDILPTSGDEERRRAATFHPFQVPVHSVVRSRVSRFPLYTRVELGMIDGSPLRYTARGLFASGKLARAFRTILARQSA